MSGIFEALLTRLPGGVLLEDAYNTKRVTRAQASITSLLENVSRGWCTRQATAGKKSDLCLRPHQALDDFPAFDPQAG